MRHAGALLAALLLLAAGAVALLVRPRLWRGLTERLGLHPRRQAGSVWVHASALGELRAAWPLVERLRARGHTVCTSASTLTGRDLMRARHPEVACHLAPIDHPWLVALALARVAPAALVLVETELWPCWIAAATRRGLPVVLVSGRISDRSYPRYRRARPWLGRSFARLCAVGARSEVDAERFRVLGTPGDRVQVTGDLKLDCAEAPAAPAPELAHRLAKTPYWVAASTHPGEEAAALDAQALLERGGAEAALVLAPRRPRRATEVAKLVRRSGREARLRTHADVDALRPGQVLVLDTLGELAGLYREARAVFVGGSLVPVGGHDVLEPAGAGRPVLFGPHTANTRPGVEILEAAGAGRTVADARQLAAALAELLRNPARADAQGAAGRSALRAHRGSAERAADLVEAHVAPGRAA